MTPESQEVSCAQCDSHDDQPCRVLFSSQVDHHCSLSRDTQSEEAQGLYTQEESAATSLACLQCLRQPSKNSLS